MKRNSKKRSPPSRSVNAFGNEQDFELTRVEAVLDAWNKEAIDAFLQAHGFGTAGQDYGRKIKEVLLIIEEIQRGIRKEKYAKK